jgi:Na+/H+ antiporter NhaC
MPSGIWTILGLGLICWRITSLLVREDGPFDIFAKFRKFVGVRYNEYSVQVGTNVFAKLLTCVWCASIWVSLALAWASEYSVNVLSYLGVSLILSVLTILIDEYFLSLERKVR